MQSKLAFTIFFAFSLAMGISKLEAQPESATKKVVVIKKTIDANGKETIVREEASGTEADKLIQKTQSEELKNSEIDIEINDSKNSWIDENGQEKDLYRIKVKDADGAMKIIEWNGEGEMPEEMKQQLENEEYETYAREHNVSNRRVNYSGDGSNNNSTGSNTSTVEIEEIILEEANSNKVQLGIMIEDHPVGVKIVDFIAGTTAEKAGLKKGDVITLFNGATVNSMQALIQEVGKYEAGDIVEVMAIRGDLEKGYKVTLQSRKAEVKTTKKYNWKKAQ